MAEILITLGIIGVVAALTITTIIKNNNRKVFATSLKKFYSQTSQALQQAAVENGCNDLYCLEIDPEEAPDKWNKNMSEFLNSKFKIVKYINNPNTNDRIQYKNLGSSHECDMSCLTKYDTGKWIVFYTNDGMKIEYLTASGVNLINVNVDVNGDKPPNRLGYDIYCFNILANKVTELRPLYDQKGATKEDGTLVPHMWWKTNKDLCDRNSSSHQNGVGCAARVIEENWEITYW